MRRGGYRGPEKTIGLIGCAALLPLYVIPAAWLIDDATYGGHGTSWIGVLGLTAAALTGSWALMWLSNRGTR